MGKAADLIKKIANQNDVKLHACKVDAVNGSTCDVTPISGDAPFKNVRLNADINSNNGIVITPVIDSVILLCEINKLDSYVSMFSEIDNISIKIGTSTIVIKNGEIKMNGGTNGIINIVDLTTKLNTAISEMQSELGKIVTAITSLGGAYAMGTLSQFNKSSYEDTKIIH